MKNIAFSDNKVIIYKHSKSKSIPAKINVIKQLCLGLCMLNYANFRSRLIPILGRKYDKLLNRWIIKMLTKSIYFVYNRFLPLCHQGLSLT